MNKILKKLTKKKAQEFARKSIRLLNETLKKLINKKVQEFTILNKTLKKPMS
jgi:hypothetical protein